MEKTAAHWLICERHGVPGRREGRNGDLSFSRVEGCGSSGTSGASLLLVFVNSIYILDFGKLLYFHYCCLSSVLFFVSKLSMSITR